MENKALVGHAQSAPRPHPHDQSKIPTCCEDGQSFQAQSPETGLFWEVAEIFEGDLDE